MLKESEKAQKIVAQPDIPEENIDGPVTLQAWGYDKVREQMNHASAVWSGEYHFTETNFMSFLLCKNERTGKYHFTANLHTPTNIVGGETRMDIKAADLGAILERGAEVVSFEIILNYH